MNIVNFEESVMSIVKTIDKDAYSTIVSDRLTVNGKSISKIKTKNILMKIYNKLVESGYSVRYHGINIDGSDYTYYLSSIGDSNV